MRYQESEVKVYRTADHSVFAKVRGNRELNTGKIRKMIRDFNNGLDLLADFPILVSESKAGTGKMEVLDGQHRLEAARQSKRPIYFIIRKVDMDLHTVAMMNSLQEKWKASDFINCYIEKGVHDYKRLQDFVETYQLPVSLGIILLECGVVLDSGMKGNLKEAFHRGEFRVKHYKQAMEIVEVCKQFSASPVWNTSPFMKAITRLLKADLCDMDELLQKFNADPTQLGNAKSYKGYLEALERIYNKGYSKRRTIF